MREALLPPLLAALTVPCLAQVAPAQAPRPDALTLQQALDQALARHPELGAAHSEVEAAEAARLQAGARPNPVLETEIEDSRRETRSTTVLLTLPIELGGKRSARIEAAERAQDIARSQLAARRSLLRAEVTAAFVQAQTAQERLRLAEQSLELARRGTDAARKRVTAGKVSPIEETKAQVAEANVRLELGQARGELRSALLTLAAVVGAGRPIERVEGTVALPPVPADDALQARLATAPSLRQVQLEVERLGAIARLERARRVPDVSVGLGAKRSEEMGRNQPMLVLSMPLPVFHTNRGAELEALRRQDKARYEAEAAALRLRAELAQAHERLKAAVAEAEAVQKEVLPGAQTAYDTATKGFELGKFSFLDVLDAQRTLLEARTRQLRATADAHRAAAELDRLLGDSTDTVAPRAQP
jgi:cobalt-zinc-cadmium efflux system outer membrane protein